MTNALFGLAILATLIKSYFYDSTWLIIYAILIIAYTVFVSKNIVKKDNSKRKTLMISSWNGKSIIFLILLQIRTYRSNFLYC